MIENILVKVGADVAGLQKGLNSATKGLGTFGKEMSAMGLTGAKALKGLSAESLAMSTEMKTAFTNQKNSLMGFSDDMVKVKYGYFQLAQGAKAYTGTTADFMSDVQKMGKQHKTVTENMIKNNDMLKMNFFQTVGTMLNRSTQASKISAEFDRIKNPLYSINKAGLAAADGLNKIALSGNASVLALKRLGPSASMKDLQNMTMMINQGLMRFTGVALIAAAGAFVFYKALHKGAMDLDKGYATAFKKMGASVKKAFEPMVQVFADVMTPVFKLITKISDMVAKFSEANPAIAKVIAGFLLLIPALTLILAPLAIGIGLTGGLTAAFGALWLVIGPIVTGFAAMMGTVLLVAAGIALLAAGVIYAYKNFEWFKTGVDTTLAFLKTTFMTAFNFIKEIVMSVMSSIVSFGKTQLDKFAAFWDENGKQITALAKAAFTILTANIRIAMGAIKAIFEMVWPIIAGVVKIAWNLIKLAISNATTVILGIIQTVLKLLQGDWKGAWETIKQTTEKLMGNVLKFLSDVDLVQIGKDIMNGLIKGIGSMADSVLNVAKDIGNSIKGAFTGLFDINSPSRYMKNFIGKNMMYGWIDGIESMKGSVISTAKDAGAWMTPAAPTLSYTTPRATHGNLSGALSGAISASVDVTESEESRLLGILINAVREGQVITLDGRKVGESVAKTVGHTLQRNSDMRNIGMGRPRKTLF